MCEAVPFPWLSAYPEGVRQKLTYPRQPLHLFLENAAIRWPQMEVLAEQA